MVAETFRPVMKAVLTGAMSGLLLVGCATTPMAPAPDRPHGGKTWPPVTSPAPTPEQPVEVEQVEIEKPAKKADERSEENTTEIQSRFDLVCRLLLVKKKIIYTEHHLNSKKWTREMERCYFIKPTRCT